MLTREQILAKKGFTIRKVAIPEWGDEVYVRGMTANERDQMEAANLITEKEKRGGLASYAVKTFELRARLVVMTVCDEAGNRLFGDSDVEAVGQLSAKSVGKLYSVAAALSGMTDEDVDDLLKN